jgi:acetyl-CoA decarbonylase/synthase complex subunit delta
MPIQRMIEKWPHAVNTVTLGALKKDGGTRTRVVKLGGETTLPFLLEEGAMPNPPAVAAEIWDVEPPDLPEPYRKAWGDAVRDPAAWAAQAEAKGAEVAVLRLAGAHPDNRNTPVDEVLKTVEAVRKATGLPLAVWGCGNAEKDNEILPRIAQLLKGENALLASATQDNYKRIAAACIADGHSVVAESPLDINICKQVNILLSEMDLPADRRVIYPSNGALGYGFEYGYSILERSRLAALGGDRMMAMPMVVLVGSECLRAKEAKAADAEAPGWGSQADRAVGWEVTTAVGYLMAGADLVVMSHPKAMERVKGFIAEIMRQGQ